MINKFLRRISALWCDSFKIFLTRWTAEDQLFPIPSKKTSRKNIWYRKLVVDSKNGLTRKNKKRRKKITFFIFNIGMIPIFSGRFFCFQIFSIINISGFINIFLNYLTQLGWVWEFSGMQVCVLLGPAVPILNGHLNNGG